MTVVLTPGYAPIEQYAAEEQQGPYSDLYSVGATIFRCLVGRHPPESTARISAIYNGNEDPALRQIKDPRNDLDPAFVSIVEWLMQPRACERPQSAMEVLTALDRLDTQNLAQSAATELYRGSTVSEPVADVPTLDLSQPAAPPASAPVSSQPHIPAPSQPVPPVVARLAQFTLSDGQLAKLIVFLAQSVGPIAKILVKKAAKSTQDQDGLLLKLSLEVDNESERKQFLRDAAKVFRSS